MQAASHQRVLEALELAVTSSNISAMVPEDLEIQAHNTLWYDSQPGELTLLKLCPSTPATSIKHEFTQVTSFGEGFGSGFFGETALPPETNIETERVINNIRLMGEIGPTFLLAALEKTQQVLGTTGAANIERKALRLNVLRKKNRNLYFSDTRNIRQGQSGVRFKGLAQLIEEGTDGTSGTSPYGSHVIDMEGQPLTAETIRDKTSEIITLFGFINTLIMAPFARGDLEASLDSAQRLEMPIALKPYLIGQQVAGLQTQGGIVHFETDNILSPIWSFGQYRNIQLLGAPSTKVAISTPAVAGAPGAGEVSKWDATSAGEIYYIVTQVKDEQEGLGRRIPAVGFLTVAAAQKVTIGVTPGDPSVDSFKIYRGTDADQNNAIGTDAYYVSEVANTGGGAEVLIVDLNAQRPNTTWAFGLNIKSDSQRAMHNGLANSYWQARDMSADFMGQKDDPMNTIAVAELGPSMGVMALASILAEVDRPLLYSACTPEVRNPFQNVVFKNIGRA